METTAPPVTLESFSRLKKRPSGQVTPPGSPPGGVGDDFPQMLVKKSSIPPSQELQLKRMNMPEHSFAERNKRRKLMQSTDKASPPDPELSNMERLYQFIYNYRMPIPVSLRYHLTDAALSKLCQWQTVKLTCLRCSRNFFEIENIGRWGCRQHVKGFNRDVPGIHHPIGRWECCGRLPIWDKNDNWPNHTNGCVECDHRADHAGCFLHPRDDVVIHPILIEHLKIPERAVSKNRVGENVFIIRLNESVANELRSKKCILRTDAVEMFDCVINKGSIY